MVEVRGATFTYEDGTRALTDVDFDVRRGEFVALLAANGCGKTTLLKLLTGLLRPQRGDVRLFGRALARKGMGELHGQVGFVLQNPRDQLFCAVVEDDVAYGPRNLGWSEPVVQQRVADALDAVGATGLRSRPVHRLSFGEQKRVAIAGVLAMNPLLLLVDEPTAGLDPLGEREVLSLLRRLNQQQGITIVLATHAVDLLPLVADRLCLLRDGRMLKAGPVTDVFSDAEAIGDAHLRLPYVADLIDQLKRLDGIPIDGTPLTVAHARQSLLALLTPARTSAADHASGGRRF
jgi:cobalt/nickel transport system ATP-binding protein